MSQDPRVKQLSLGKDVVLLVSHHAEPDKRRQQARKQHNAALAALLLNSGSVGRNDVHDQTWPTMNELELVGGFLGRPELRVDGLKGPSISFSHAIESTWAALCLSEGSVGIDATDPNEFAGAYPFHRVFDAEEWRLAEAMVAGNRLECAALLWSAKEAVVKALGCGFHLIDPVDVRVLLAGPANGMVRADVRFSEATTSRFQALHSATVRVACFKESALWVAVAVSSWTAALEASLP